MTLSAGPDVPDKDTHVCAVDREGAIFFMARRVCDGPEMIARMPGRHATGTAGWCWKRAPCRPSCVMG